MGHKKEILKFIIVTLLCFSCSILHADWTPAQDLSSGGSVASDPDVAIDSSGKGYAVWAESSPLNQIVVSTYESGTWSSPLSIATPVGTITDLMVGANASGWAVVSWDDGAEHLFASVFNGVFWEPAVNIVGLEPVAIDPYLSVASVLSSAIIWQDGDPGVNIVASFYNPLLPGWEFAFNISNDLTVNHSDPRIGVSDVPPFSKGAVAAWHAEGGGVSNIRANVYDGLSWQTPIILSEVGHTVGKCEIAVDVLTNNAIVVWEDNDAGTITLKSKYYDFASDTWSSLPLTIATLAAPGAEFTLAMDSDGQGILIFTDGLSGFSALGGISSWSSPTLLTTDMIDPEVAGGASGQATATWLNSSGVVQVASLNSNTWSSIDNLSNAGAVQPEVAMNQSGQALDVWELSSVIQASVSTIPVGPVGPTDFRGVAKPNVFATQTEYVHLLRWTASTDPTVVGYRVSQGGQLLVQTSDTTAIIHDCSKTIPVTYSLVAYDASNNESSPPLTLTLP